MSFFWFDIVARQLLVFKFIVNKTTLMKLSTYLVKLTGGFLQNIYFNLDSIKICRPFLLPQCHVLIVTNFNREFYI